MGGQAYEEAIRGKRIAWVRWGRTPLGPRGGSEGMSLELQIWPEPPRLGSGPRRHSVTCVIRLSRLARIRLVERGISHDETMGPSGHVIGPAQL